MVNQVKQPSRKAHHSDILGWQYQDSYIKTQIVKEWLGGARRIIFTHELAHLSPDLKFIESLWDLLEQSARLLHCQYKILTKNVCTSWWKFGKKVAFAKKKIINLFVSASWHRIGTPVQPMGLEWVWLSVWYNRGRCGEYCILVSYF